ncbi:unnamed protein product [Boreogadus saida]
MESRLGSLPVGLSTSQHQDQHPHYQESEEDRQEMEQCVEEGEEDMGEVNSTDSCAEEKVGCSASQHHDQNAHYQEFGKDKEEEEENLCDTNAREEEWNCPHVKDAKGGNSKGERLEEERDESASPTGGVLQIHTPGQRSWRACLPPPLSICLSPTERRGRRLQEEREEGAGEGNVEISEYGFPQEGEL